MPELTPPTEEKSEARQPWQPLEFEKIAVADAEANLGGSSFDTVGYS